VPNVTFTTGGALKKSSLRQANERVVLNTIRENPSMSRADIARYTGLSPSSVTFILNRLKREKMVTEEQVANHSQVGRRPTALHLRPEARMAVAVEISGSGSRVALADLNGRIISDKMVLPHRNHEVYLDRVHSAIKSLVDNLPPDVVLGAGVGLPGTIDRASGKVIAAENLGWFGVDAGAMLRQQLPFPFLYENTCKLSAFAEMWFAQPGGQRLNDFVFVTARGGLGTGVIIRGQILQGAYSAAAEFGHTTLYADGRPCACGSTGCLEQYASDFALCRLYTELNGESGQEDAQLTASDIIQKARAGDAVARRAVEQWGRYAAIGFANLIWALNPEAIILGDSFAEAWDLIAEIVWETVRRRVAAYYVSAVRIFPSQHAANAPLLGAVALVLARYFTSFDPRASEGRTHSVLMSSQNT